MDHWSAPNHTAERTHLVHLFQELAAARGFRITFMSGDVHVAAVGRFMSWPKRNLRTDHRRVGPGNVHLPCRPACMIACVHVGGEHGFWATHAVPLPCGALVWLHNCVQCGSLGPYYVTSGWV